MKIDNIEIEVTRKDIKNVHLYVKPPEGKVTLSCPFSFSDENIEFFLRTKLGWIKKQQSRFQKHERQTTREYVSGETVYLLGNPYFLIVKESKKSYSIALNGKNIVFTVRSGSTIQQKNSFFNEWYRKNLREEIDKRLQIWESKTGLYATSYQIKDMKTRWGSCNHEKKTLLFNLQLAKKDFQAISYVILHELAHIQSNHHDAEFISILDKYMPNWREIKKGLNDSISNPWKE